MRRVSDLAIPTISSGRSRPKFQEADVEKDIQGLGVAGTAALKLILEKEENLLTSDCDLVAVP